MNENYKWPTERPVIVDNAFGSGLSLLKEKFGALSQDSSSIFSRICIGNSLISLEPYRGCPLGCVYCMANNDLRSLDLDRETDDYRQRILRKPEKIFDSADLVKGMIKHPAFIPHKSIIGFCTGSSEFFLPELSNNIWDGLKVLMENGLRNPLWIVAKSFLAAGYEKDWLERFEIMDRHGIRVILSISDIGAPPEIEPYQTDRFQAFRFLKNSSVVVSHHMRPIIPDTPNLKEKIRELLMKSKGFVESICVGGLRIDPGMKIFWDNEGIRRMESSSGSQVKHFDQEIIKITKTTLNEIGSEVPVFHKSSQMISYHLGIPEFNLYEYRKNSHAFMEIEEKERRSIEAAMGRPLEEILHSASVSIGLDTLEFTRNGNEVHINTVLNYQEERALIHAIGHTGLFKRNDET